MEHETIADWNDHGKISVDTILRLSLLEVGAKGYADAFKIDQIIWIQITFSVFLGKNFSVYHFLISTVTSSITFRKKRKCWRVNTCNCSHLFCYG